MKSVSNNVARQRRHTRVRNKISGTPECPRLNVFRSNSQIFAQIIDDENTTDEELMGIIKGPDFPTEGIILGMEGIKQAYTTGRGKITVRARTEIVEAKNGRYKIIVD